ncbi:hypothetical protein [Parachitinimonas caeni]|uniref:Tox-GHH2 domain-containing protein n=1 Tax=Parachitinimonas caeni TaxID=3031301 RepID=A0ABT7DTG3_9NEIS|nr:hypothetical protein [Parachitinimonas caeni]MDK2123365.1 hypothetical protein [Parachitinimonas caeni]
MSLFPIPKPKPSTSKPTRRGKGKTSDKAPEYRPVGQSKYPVSRRVSGPNTATFYYLDTKRFPVVCEDDRNRIRNECDTHGGKQRSKDSMQEARLDPRKHPPGSLTRRLQDKFKDAVTTLDNFGKQKVKYKKNPQNAWLEDHCSGQWNKPGGDKVRDADDNATLDTPEAAQTMKREKSGSIEEFKKQIEGQVGGLQKQFEGKLAEAHKKLTDFAWDYMKQHGKDAFDGAAEKMAQRKALTRFPLLAKALSRLSFYEGLGTLIGNTAGAIATDDMAKAFDILEKELDAIRQQIDDCRRMLSEGGLEDIMASTQAGIALANPCLKARKCMLVPYKDTGKTSKGQGCCPGQTGHHLLPGAMFRKYSQNPETKKYAPEKVSRDSKKIKPRPCWESYEHGDAPTMCLEGTTNNATNGSHGAAHEVTGELLEKDREQPDMPYTVARDKIATALGRAFGCNPQCIIEQLDAYYKKIHNCGPLESATVTPHSGNQHGGPKPAPTEPVPTAPDAPF